MQFRIILLPIDGTLISIDTPGQSGPERNVNKGRNGVSMMLVWFGFMAYQLLWLI